MKVTLGYDALASDNSGPTYSGTHENLQREGSATCLGRSIMGCTAESHSKRKKHSARKKLAKRQHQKSGNDSFKKVEKR